MKKTSNIPLAILIAIMLALGAYQGRRVGFLRESEMFYRWILAEATQLRMFAQTGETDPEAARMKDRELFDRVQQAVEPHITTPLETVDEKGNAISRLVALTKDETNDRIVWDLARSPVLDAERRDFLAFLREGKLMGVSSEFDPNQIYSGEGGNVGLSNIFFGFRKVAANFVWLQVDKYWHQGLMHRMIPLMQTCVKLDPTFVDAYLLGSWHLAYNATAKMPDTPEPLKKFNPKYGVRLGEKETYYYLAIDFLKDGIRKNPRNYKLYFDLGFSIYKEKLKDYANAVKYLSEAIRHRHDRWVPRQLYICFELNGQYEEAKAGWTDYLNKNLGNVTEEPKARRFIARNDGLIRERNAEKALERANALKDSDPAQAEAARHEAERLRAEAMDIWKEMTEGPGEPDSFALGRIMRMEAIKLIEEERYLEAIAVLQNAWSKSAPFAEEALKMIIDVKLKAGIPLSLSEKKAVLRREEAEKYRNAPVEQPK